MNLNNGDPYTASAAVTINSSVTDATEMRFRNAGGSWSGWEPYSDSKTWTLSAGDGDKTVYAEYRTAPGNALALSDDIVSGAFGFAAS